MRDGFAEVLRGQPGTGAGFAAWCDGRPVVDLRGGYADSARSRPWEADSLVQPYSVSKPFVAVCALCLVEAGRLDLDAPVQRYWREFRAPATVRQVLSHQAGVVKLDKPAPTEAFYDWDWLCRLLALRDGRAGRQLRRHRNGGRLFGRLHDRQRRRLRPVGCSGKHAAGLPRPTALPGLTG